LKQVFPLNKKVWTTERMTCLHEGKNIFLNIKGVDTSSAAFYINYSEIFIEDIKEA